MRRVLPVVGVVVVVVIGLVWWLTSRDSKRPGDQPAAAATSTSGRDGARTREPAKPATVSGKVTRKADGGAVAGAVISLARAELGASFEATKTPSIVVTASETGAWTATDVAPGDYVIAATAPGLLPAARDKLTIASGEQRTGIDFALEAGGTLVRGTVSDVGGGPIESARVTATRSAMSFAAEAEYVALTAPDGSYQLTLPDGSYGVAAAHDNYTRSSKNAAVDGKPVTLDFTLIPGGVIRGQVIARDTGTPLPRALVSVRGQRRSLRGDGERAVLADDKGEFVLRGLSSGAMSIEARGQGYASEQPTLVQLGIGEEVDGIQVLVDRAFSISGRVVKQGTQTGIAGARLGAFSMSQGAQIEAIDPTDDHGLFEIAGVKPGNYMLYAAAEGTLLEIGHDVEVVDKDITDVVVELGTGVTLGGRVEPAEVATVHLELQAEVGLGNMFDMIKAMMCRGESDAQGNFTLNNAPPGKLVIVAQTKDGRTGKTPITVAAVDQSGLVVKLEPRASIAGRVVDTSGKPVEGVRVNADPQEERAARFSMAGMRDGTKTAADGSFKIVGLEPGSYDVNARSLDETVFFSSDDKGKDKHRTIVELAAGAEKTGVKLTVEARDGVIRGTVVGADGKPAADAWVTARRELERLQGMTDEQAALLRYISDAEPVLTNERGAFVITKLRKGTYTLVAEGPRGGSRGEKSGVKIGETTTIQLASLGAIVLSVSQGGNPVTSYDVDCTGTAGNIDRRASAADGTYRLGPLAPGDYTCKVHAKTGTAEGKVTVPSGEVALALALAPWGSLTGVVVSVLTGKPVPGLAVVTSANDNAGGIVDAITGRAPKTDANGRFLLEQVAAGKGRVIFVAQEAAMASMESHEYEAKAGQRVDLGTIKIVPPRTGDAGTFGLATVMVDDTLQVADVKEGGPAARAGIVVGDTITALAGQPVKTLTLPVAQKLIASGTVGVNETVAVTLARGPTVTLTSVRW